MRLRTGAALYNDGRYYLFYGAAPDHVDRVVVATSTDLVRWQRCAANPIAVPDPRWYEHDHTTCPIGNWPRFSVSPRGFASTASAGRMSRFDARLRLPTTATAAPASIVISRRTE